MHEAHGWKGSWLCFTRKEAWMLARARGIVAQCAIGWEDRWAERLQQKNSFKVLHFSIMFKILCKKKKERKFECSCNHSRGTCPGADDEAADHEWNLAIDKENLFVPCHLLSAINNRMILNVQWWNNFCLLPLNFQITIKKKKKCSQSKESVSIMLSCCPLFGSRVSGLGVSIK